MNPPIQKVVQNDIIKWLDTCLVYHIPFSKFVSQVQCVLKKDVNTIGTYAKTDFIQCSC